MKHFNKKNMIVIPLIVVAILLAIGSAIWGDYRDKIMQNHKDQLLLTTKALAENMSLSLAEYQDDLEFLSEMDKKGCDKEIFRTFLETQSRYDSNLIWEDSEGTIIDSIYEATLKKSTFLAQMDADKSVWQYMDADGHCYLVVKKQMADDTVIGLVIDEERYYSQLISDIHIGTNGYVVVKNSSGIIVMHPEKRQWGIHVIQGRKEFYPHLDLDSLEHMTNLQLSGATGISEYYSYWWNDPQLPRVKKISTYMPAKVGEDFWIVSAVIDYDDFYVPIEDGFRNLSLLFVCAVIVFVGLFLYIAKLTWKQKKADVEIESLKALNEQMEEIRKGQEMLAHQQRLQVMGTMTGGIAHEFNNFLTPIMGYAELLMMKLDEESESYDNAAEIYEASEKAKEMVRQISSLSRRNVETVYKTIAIRKQLTRALKMVESICPPNVHMETHLDPITDETTLGNATQINQVLLNICVNAFHAIGQKSGCLTISAACVPCADILKKESLKKFHFSDIWSQYLCIDIADDGCGMDGDTLRQIFDPFFTTKKAGEGTGLGLALAEQIITSHKGGIYAESELGKGTVFHILLPVVNQGEMIELPKTDEKSMQRMIVADDNAKVLQMLKKNFHKLGVDILTCRDKSEIQEYLKEMRADVLILDESLEDGSGIEFCMAVQGKYPDMIKLVMVDYFTKEIVEAKHNGIIDGYLIKPVSDTTILEAIRSVGRKQS